MRHGLLALGKAPDALFEAVSARVEVRLDGHSNAAPHNTIAMPAAKLHGEGGRSAQKARLAGREGGLVWRRERRTDVCILEICFT